MQEIRTEHLTVGYDKTPLIGDVNLSVRPGEILTLIGPNGSGKSTILKTIKETGWNRIFGRSIHG